MAETVSLLKRKFHWLVVIKEIGKRKGWCVCRCKCKKTVTVKRHRLLSNHTRSCGCFQSFVTARRNTKHGKSHLPEYTTWCGMIDRCYRPKNKRYARYGGRGIRVCKRWRHSFENFLSDMGRRPSPQHSIERGNNNGDYTPSNCQWATAAIQNRNNRRNVKFSYNGETKTVSDWARSIGLSFSCLRSRLAKPDWSLEKAMTAPSRWRNNKVTYEGQSKTVSEWSTTLGIPEETIRRRIYKNRWRTYRAFNTKNKNL